MSGDTTGKYFSQTGFFFYCALIIHTFHSFFHSFTRSFLIHSFIFPSIPLFIRLFILFIHSFVYSFIRSLSLLSSFFLSLQCRISQGFPTRSNCKFYRLDRNLKELALSHSGEWLLKEVHSPRHARALAGQNFTMCIILTTRQFGRLSSVQHSPDRLYHSHWRAGES
jgi:hypothetical protein